MLKRSRRPACVTERVGGWSRKKKECVDLTRATRVMLEVAKRERRCNWSCRTSLLVIGTLVCIAALSRCFYHALTGADCGPYSCCGIVRTMLYWLFSGGSRGATPMQGSTVNFFRVVPHRKLLFCDIAKNANQAFSDLLCSLMRSHEQPAWERSFASRMRTWDDFEQGCTWISTNPASVGMNASQTWQAFNHQLPGWTSAVFVRDPLERFLSGYRSKCEPGHDPDRHVCGYVFGAKNASFAHAVRAINATRGDLKEGTAEDHFRLQSSFCDGAVGAGRFDLYYVLDRATSRANVVDMLGRVGVDKAYLSAAVPAFDYHFPPPPPTPPYVRSALSPPPPALAGLAPADSDLTSSAEATANGGAASREHGVHLAQTPTASGASEHPTAHPSAHHLSAARPGRPPPPPQAAGRTGHTHIYGGGEHVTHSGKASIRMQYYSDPALVAAVLRHYAPDYRNLPISVPVWAVDMVGKDYVQSLGLEA